MGMLKKTLSIMLTFGLIFVIAACSKQEADQVEITSGYPEIVNVYKEHVPALRFIGKCYTRASYRQDNGFGHKWNDWFENDWFTPLEALDKIPEIENSYLGFKKDTFFQSGFEYWIGMFLSADTDVPEGYDFFDLDESDIGICWIKVKEEELQMYDLYNQCLTRLTASGMENLKKDDNGRAFHFERYNFSRFTERDEQGYVIMDYGIFLAD